MSRCCCNMLSLERHHLICILKFKEAQYTIFIILQLFPLPHSFKVYLVLYYHWWLLLLLQILEPTVYFVAHPGELLTILFFFNPFETQHVGKWNRDKWNETKNSGFIFKTWVIIAYNMSVVLQLKVVSFILGSWRHFSNLSSDSLCSLVF